MPEFDENILRNEEIKSGFASQDPNDDSFMLEKLERYQGDLPDLDETTTQSSSTELLEKQDLSTQNEVTRPAEEIEKTVPMTSTSLPEQDEQTIDTEVPIIKDFELYEEELQQDQPVEPSDKEESLPKTDFEETVEIDETLKTLLKEELVKSKSKTSPEPADEEVQDEIEQDETLLIDQVDNANVIDLSAIEADRPSKYFQKEEQVSDEKQEDATTRMEISKPTKKPAVKPDDSGEIKEKKKRKPIPWRLMAIPAAAALFLIIIGSLSYLLLFDENSSLYLFKEAKDTLAIQIHTPKPDTTEIVAKKKEITPLDTPKAETSKLKEKEQPAVAKIDTSKPKRQEKPKQIEIIPKKEKLETIKPDYAYKPIDKPVRPAQQVRNEIYTIQVYASPSKEDAEEWLERLKTMNIENPFITTQKIRDKIWYRVRFGNFNTREEARSLALKYGFAQSWIDRVQ